MKKTLIISLLAILFCATSLFAGTARSLYQKIDCVAPNSILDYVTNTTGSDNAYHITADILETDGELMGTALGTPATSLYIRKLGLGNEAVPYYVAIFVQLGTFPTQWYPGDTLRLTVTHIATGEVSDPWDITIPTGTGLVNLVSTTMPVPPFPAAGHTLTVNSNYPGAAIYLDGADTGEVTPYTFDPAEAGTYTVVLPNVEWTPAEYVYAAEADETVGFVGVLNPAVPTII